MKSLQPRQSLLRQAFCDIPQGIAGITLRPLSAASFELLAELGNPMFSSSEGKKGDSSEMLAAVCQYVWVHSADLEKVAAIETIDQVPAAEVKAIGFKIEVGEALHFTSAIVGSALRMAAAMAEEFESGDELGKLETSLTGSPPSSSSAGAPEIPSGKGTSSGSPPLSELSPTSTPPTPMLEEDLDGSTPLTILPTPDSTPQESDFSPPENDSKAKA